MRIAAVCLLMVAAIASNLPGQESVPPDHAEKMKAGLSLFKQDVRSILEDKCLKCHNAKSKKGDFDLSTRSALTESGHVGDSAPDSHLLQVVRHEAEPHMPHKAEKLDDKQIELLAKWIELGVPYDKPLGNAASNNDRPAVTDEDREFWSFQPLVRPVVPKTHDDGWCKTDVDRFIFSKLAATGLRPNESADRRTLIRRAYFDLLGLPPSPHEVDQFVADQRPDAWERLIDRLLGSRHYGERWARHWIDVARFAESSGFEHDDNRPNAYHYRDFLIKALNDDLPYNEFIRWQLAGDEVAPDNPLAMAATGFLTAGPFPTQITETEFEPARYDELDDMVTNTGLTFLGLSVGCARCHDHKFDPIPTRDYYQMAATFVKAVRSEVDLVMEPAGPPTKVQVTAVGYPPMKNHADGRGYPYFYESVQLLGRGDVSQKQGAVEQGFVQVLMRNGMQAAAWRIDPPGDWQRSEFRRASLANWMTDPEYGAGQLAARVIVNRLWQHHVGTGIVATPNDFGMQGERPTHPELLEHLAMELLAGGWRLKQIHKQIMTSSVYKQSGAHDQQRAALDPENKLHWRHTPRRLEAEAIRDAMLSVSGMLDRTMYGGGSLDQNMTRRSLYFTIKRSQLIPMMMLFDWPEHLVSIGQRATTTTAPQALLFMNSPQGRKFAEEFARSIYTRHKKKDEKLESIDLSQTVNRAYARAFSRPPSAQETELAIAFVNNQIGQYEDQGDAASEIAVTDLCQAILSMNEFVYVK